MAAEAESARAASGVAVCESARAARGVPHNGAHPWCDDGARDRRRVALQHDACSTDTPVCAESRATTTSRAPTRFVSLRELAARYAVLCRATLRCGPWRHAELRGEATPRVAVSACTKHVHADSSVPSEAA